MKININIFLNIQKIKITIDRTVNFLCTDEGLMSYLQMYSTGVCYVLFRWDMAWGRKLFLCLAVLVLSAL